MPAVCDDTSTAIAETRVNPTTNATGQIIDTSKFIDNT